MELKEIRELIKLVKRYDVQEFTLKRGEDSVRIRMGAEAQTVPAPAARVVQGAPAPATPSAPAAVPAGGMEDKLTVGENQFVVTSPIVGTFYCAPSPESPPYVQVGDQVEKGRVLCIVEAMKLMNEIECEVRGTVEAVLVENAQPVEYGEPLFIINLR